MKYFAFIFILMFAALAVPNFAFTYEMGVAADSSVSQAGSGNNYAAQNQMTIQASSVADRWFNFYMFDMSTIPSYWNVSQIQIQLFNNDWNSINGSYIAAINTSPSWTETNLTYTGMPAESVLQSRTNITTPVNRYWTWNVTDAGLYSKAQANKNLSLILRYDDSTGSNNQLYFISKENANSTRWPKLLLTYTSPVLVIGSVFDENNLSKSLPFNIEIFNDTFSMSAENVNTFNSSSIEGSVTASISSPGYSTRYYYLNLSSTTSYTTNFYLLNTTGALETTFTVKNYDQLIRDAFINITMLNSSSRLIVAQGKTDTSGIFPFTLNPTRNYRIEISKSGYVTSTQNIIPTLSQQTFNIFTGESTIPSYWENYKNQNGACTFSNATRILTCTWTDTSGDFNNATLNVIRRNSTNTWTICSNASSSSSGSLTCGFGVPNNNTFAWSLKLESPKGQYISLSSDSWTDAKPGVSLGLTGLFIAFLLILVCAFAGVQLQNPVIMIMMTLIAVAFSFLMGLVDFSGGMITFLFGLFAAGAILIYKVR